MGAELCAAVGIPRARGRLRRAVEARGAGREARAVAAEAAGGVDITDASDAPGTKVTIKAPGGAKTAVGEKAPPFSALASPQPAFDADATTHEALIDAIGGECGTERMMRSVLCGWKDEGSKVETIA